jgi:hypothetical protein
MEIQLSREPRVRFDTPENHAFLEWNFPSDLATTTSGTATTAGVMQLARFTATKRRTLSTLGIVVGTAGNTVADVVFAVYSLNFTTGIAARVAVSANVAATVNWATTGLKTVTLSAFTPNAGEELLAGWVFGSAVTVPTFTRINTASTVAINVGQSASAATPLRYSTAGTGLTTMPATIDVTTASASAYAPWIGLR